MSNLFDNLEALLAQKPLAGEIKVHTFNVIKARSKRTAE